MRKIGLAILLAVFTVTACTEAPEKQEKVVLVTPEKISDLKVVTIIDVRTPEEFSEGHINGARNIDFHSPDFEKQVEALDKNGSVLVYCQAGGRSAQAADHLMKTGFVQVYDLRGGFEAYQETEAGK